MYVSSNAALLCVVVLAMRVLQVLDHVGIYLVIVGTMTPFMLVGLHHHTSARVLICAEWIAAFLGSIFAGRVPSRAI